MANRIYFSDRDFITQTYVTVGDGFTTINMARPSILSRSDSVVATSPLTLRTILRSGRRGGLDMLPVNVVAIYKGGKARLRSRRSACHSRRIQLPSLAVIGDTCELVETGQTYQYGWSGRNYEWLAIGDA